MFIFAFYLALFL